MSIAAKCTCGQNPYYCNGRGNCPSAVAIELELLKNKKPINMPINKKSETTLMVRVDKTIHKKVKAKTKNTRQSIGGFYDEAAEEKLKSKPTTK